MKVTKPFDPDRLLVTGVYLICTYREDPKLPVYSKEEIEDIISKIANKSLELKQVHIQDGERMYWLEDSDVMNKVLKETYLDKDKTQQN